MDLEAVSGAGSAISNVLDYSKWLKAFMGMSLPISDSAHKSLKRGRILVDEPKDGWAFTGPVAYALGVCVFSTIHSSLSGETASLR